MSTQPLLIAHRGASHDAPENTLAAFELAYQRGADGVEGDFHLTRDKRIVCLHDASTGRTAGLDLDCAGSTLSELRTLDVGCWKDRSWHGQCIPTLEEVLHTVPQGRHLYIEIKCGPQIISHLAALLSGTDTDSAETVVISFDPAVIAEAKQLMPRRCAYWLVDLHTDPQTGRLKPPVEEIVEQATQVGADGVSCRAHELIDQTFVDHLDHAGLSFHVWTVNDVDAARRFSQLGASSITTDRPGWLRRHLSTGS